MCIFSVCDLLISLCLTSLRGSTNTNYFKQNLNRKASFPETKKTDLALDPAATVSMEKNKNHQTCSLLGLHQLFLLNSGFPHSKFSLLSKAALLFHHCHY